MLSQSAAVLRFLVGLYRHARHPLSPHEASDVIRRQMEGRADSFLRILDRGVYRNAGSPYLALLEHADVSFADVERAVHDHGLEETLGRLHDEGVRLSIDEFKGRVPVCRPGLEIPVSPQDFDNPLLAGFYRARTGGSRSPGLSVAIDIELLRHEAAYMVLYMEEFDLLDRPESQWLGAPPVTAGMQNLLRYSGAGKTVERWFAQTGRPPGAIGLACAAYESFSLWTVRAAGRPAPRPLFTPREGAGDVARHLAARVAEGRPGTMSSNATSAVRVCLAAREAGLDISGTHFRLGGEPLTVGKLAVIHETGCTAITQYAMAELGLMGIPCAEPRSHDDSHLLTDKLAVVVRERTVGPHSPPVPSLIFTTLLPGSPKLMLNVESGDYGVFERRPCRCAFGRLGLDAHLSDIRSFEKLTGEGVTFLGTELHRILEELLPSEFGGAPTDYQLAEEEDEGLTTIRLRVSPSIGDLDEEAVRETVLRELFATPGGGLMVDQWRQGDTFRVERADPYVTSSAKILPLHINKEATR
ncbi:MAG: hypothetical protein R3195_16505 [Gemmatimonadota bacterium]|nr:hypothetical protein [Gemmatimonadota bacterium]